MRLIFMTIGSIAIIAASFFITLHFIDAYGLMKMSPDQLRKADVGALQQALRAYEKAHHTYQVKGAGSGGMGWVNFCYDGAPSLVKALHDGGYLTAANLNDRTSQGNYLIYVCDGGRRYSVSATLDHPSAADVAHAQITCNATGPNGTFTPL